MITRFFHQQGPIGEAHAIAAALLGQQAADVAELAQFGQQLPGEFFALLVCSDYGRDPLAHEATDVIPQ